MTAINFNAQLAKTVEKVKKTRQRMPIRRNGKVVVAIVPAEDFRVLEEMDRLDVKIARAALANARAKGEKPIPWQDAKKQLKL